MPSGETRRGARNARAARREKAGGARPSAGKMAPMLHFAQTLGLYAVTAVAEILGCYLFYLWLERGAPAWMLVPATACLAAFAWLLTLHPHATGRVYAAYGGVYIGTALVWLWAVDGVRPTWWDAAGASIALLGMALIAFQPR